VSASVGAVWNEKTKSREKARNSRWGYGRIVGPGHESQPYVTSLPMLTMVPAWHGSSPTTFLIFGPNTALHFQLPSYFCRIISAGPGAGLPEGRVLADPQLPSPRYGTANDDDSIN
jgi:hypothetical protein